MAIEGSSASVRASTAYRVLAACDLTEFAGPVLSEAVTLARGHSQAELHLVTVVQKAKERYVLTTGDSRCFVTRDVLESLMNDLIRKTGIPEGRSLEETMRQVTLHVCVGEPAAEILRLSRELAVDAIVVGCREPLGLQRRVWGSVSRTVKANAGCSVVLVRLVDGGRSERTPVVEPPCAWKSDGYHLQMHHYHV
jgi:nucleotide-binding universal stress UspA family protein